MLLLLLFLLSTLTSLEMRQNHLSAISVWMDEALKSTLSELLPEDEGVSAQIQG